MHYSVDIELAQVLVLLTDSHVQNGFAGAVAHRHGSADLVVDGIELRQDDGVDLAANVVWTELRNCLSGNHGTSLNLVI